MPIQGDLVPLIRQSWAATMPDVPFEPDSPWRDSGADSLRALMFVLHLEQALGCKVPFDLLSPESTARTLALALARGENEFTTFGRHVHLIPGIGGDEPLLSDFRRIMGPELSFTTLTLPDLDTSGSVMTSIAETARVMRQQITSDTARRPIVLMGFSFGGLVAVELACQLQDEGMPVQLVCLLDSLLAYDQGARARMKRFMRDVAIRQSAKAVNPAFARSVAPERRDLIFRMEQLLVGGLCRVQAYSLARCLFPLFAPALPLERRIARRLQLLAAFRYKAMLRWRPRRYAGAVVLLASDDPRAHASVDQWQAICPHLRTARVGGVHREMLSPDSMSIIRPVLLEALCNSEEQNSQQTV